MIMAVMADASDTAHPSAPHACIIRRYVVSGVSSTQKAGGLFWGRINVGEGGKDFRCI